jgi:hypothetical protein
VTEFQAVEGKVGWLRYCLDFANELRGEPDTLTDEEMTSLADAIDNTPIRIEVSDRVAGWISYVEDEVRAEEFCRHHDCT